MVVCVSLLLVIVIIINNHDRCVKLLCKCENNLKAKTLQDDTSLHIASRRGYLEILKYLLNQGADKETKYLQYCMPALYYIYMASSLCSNTIEGTPLASAASAGKDSIVAYLLSIGACSNGSTDRYLLKVAIHTHTVYSILLVSNCLLIQNTPLLLAAKKGHSKVVKLLLDDVVDVSTANEEGHNCLVEAILSGHR